MHAITTFIRLSARRGFIPILFKYFINTILPENNKLLFKFGLSNILKLKLANFEVE